MASHLLLLNPAAGITIPALDTRDWHNIPHVMMHDVYFLIRPICYTMGMCRLMYSSTDRGLRHAFKITSTSLPQHNFLYFILNDLICIRLCNTPRRPLSAGRRKVLVYLYLTRMLFYSVWLQTITDVGFKHPTSAYIRKHTSTQLTCMRITWGYMGLCLT